MYSPLVLEHFTHPRNTGELTPASATGRAANPACGDLVVLSLSIAGERILAARFQARGCPATIACGSRLTELVEGLDLAAAASLDRAALAASLGGLPATSNHGAALAVLALRDALAAHRAAAPTGAAAREPSAGRLTAVT